MQVKYNPCHGTLKCKTCGKITPRLATSQMFCPKCGLVHKKTMDHKRSVLANKKRKEDKKNEKPPKFYCECGALIQLDFKPLEENMRWLQFRCPECGHKISN